MRVYIALSMTAGAFLTCSLAAAAAPGRSPRSATLATTSAHARARSVEVPASSEATPQATPTTFVRTGAKTASGPRWFKDADGGVWLGKPAKGDEHNLDRIGNEQAAFGIYRLAEGSFGTATPEVQLVKVEGKPLLLSKKVPLSEARSFSEDQLRRFGDGFVIDAWLANWDIGAAWQLAADASGKPVRTEGAGGGLFRTRGDPKGSAFTDEVLELQTMRDPLRATSFAFRKVSDRDLKEQIQRFAGWYPAHKSEIETLIDATTMSAASAVALKTKLGTRAQWIIARARK